MKNINFPNKKTYFICYLDSVVKAYGEVDTNQCMSTHSDNIVNTYEDKQEYKDALVEEGISIDELD